MRRICSLVAAAVVTAAPAIARADDVAAPQRFDLHSFDAISFEVPAGYFTGATRSWDFAGCANTMVGWNAVGRVPINGQAFCVQGRATFGMRVGGTYDLVYATALATTPLADAYGSTYTFTPSYSGANYVYSAACRLGCIGSGVPVARDIGAFHGFGIPQLGFDALLPYFDPAAVAPTYLAYSVYENVPGFPYSHPDDVFTLEIRAFTATPEPTTLALIVGGVATMGAMVRRRRV